MTKRATSEASNGLAKRQAKPPKAWKVEPSDFSKLCANPIRKIVDGIKKPANSSKMLIPLSLGALNARSLICFCRVGWDRSMKHNGYIHSAGSEAARAAIAQHYGSKRAPLTMDDIIVGSGCSGAIEIALRGLLNPGDNILLPKPGFPLYQAICEAHQIQCKFYNLMDEIYGDMVFGGNAFFPMATLTKTVPVVAVGGLAKQFLIPGWRVGWVMVHDRSDILKDVRAAYFKLSQNILGANSLVQSSIPDLLTPVPGSAEERSLAAFKKRYFATLEENCKFTIDALSKIPGLKVVVPQGAMYAMVRHLLPLMGVFGCLNSHKFARCLQVQVQTDILTQIKDDFDLTQKLLDEESVFVLPGQCFGMTNYFRIVFSAPREVLDDAYTRLAGFCERHQ
ncbi:hypothetical protein BBJ28_00003109 [Nothophytophthora sp. Chile5]|nr:hypothetical protein BBJ28_00003109 [Nothophytophthora sp. Chile5]